MANILKSIKRIVLKFNLKLKGVDVSNISDDTLYETDDGRYICTSCGYDFSNNYRLIESDKCPRCGQVFNKVSYNPYYMCRVIRPINHKEGDLHIDIHYK